MKDDKLQAVLNKQINAELYSAYLYLAMAAYFEESNLKGAAHWMRVQSKEEMKHAMMFYKHIHDRRWQVSLTAIEAPKSTWGSPVAAFEDAFAHEQSITKKIDDLMDLAISTKDYATQSFLKWFVDEQVEEETNANENVQAMRMVSKHHEVLWLLDAELGKRKASE